MTARALSPFLVLLVLTLPLAPPAGADGESWTARLVDLKATYGSERWKYETATEPPTSPTALVTHAQNQTVSYESALGLMLRADVDVQYTGSETAPSCQANSRALYGVTARIPTPKGPIDAHVVSVDDCLRFQLLFDLDGSNHADAQGRSVPALTPGAHTIEVVIFKRVNDNPPTVRVGETTFRFTYLLPYQQVEVSGLSGLPHQQDVPDAIFRLYTDIGWDRSVRMVLRPANASTTLTLAYDFGLEAQGQAVELRAFLARRVLPDGETSSPVSPPAPNLPVVGENRTVSGATENFNRFVTIEEWKLGDGRVDEGGQVSFAVAGRSLLPEGIAGGVVVVAASLTSNFVARDCPGDCRGGEQYRVGATELVVPVLADPAPSPSIHAYDLATQQSAPPGTPGPIAQAVASANALEVFVRDPAFQGAAPPPSGDLWAIVADVRSPNPLSSASLVPSQSESQMLVGELPVRTIQAERVHHYRVLAMLYDRDVLRGIALADRGYSLGVEAPVAYVPPGAGGLYLNFTSRTTDYDRTLQESGYGIRITYQITVTGRPAVTNVLTLPEAGNASVFVPVEASQAGRVAVTINTTSGDVLPRARDAGVEFEEEPEPENLADRIPGFEAVAVLAALVVWAWRRRA